MKGNNCSHSPAWILISLLISAALTACTPAEPPGESAAESGSPSATESEPASATGSGMSTVDLIVEGEYIVTMDENQTVVKGGAVAIKDGLIVALASAADINAQYAGVLEDQDSCILVGVDHLWRQFSARRC